LPLAAPGVFTAAILAFINAWNEFLFGVSFTTNDTVRPVTVGLVNFFGGASYIIPWGEIAAGAIIVTVPLIVVVLILQRRIVAGHAHTGHLPTSGTPHTHALGTPHTHTPGAHGPHGHAIKGSGLHGATGRMPAIPHRVAATFGWTLSWFSPLVLAAGALCFGG